MPILFMVSIWQLIFFTKIKSRPKAVDIFKKLRKRERTFYRSHQGCLRIGPIEYRIS